MEPLVLDVREDIRRGIEPFPKIMQAVQSLAPGQALVIINAFEPRPLYRVLEAQGFQHRTEETEDGCWRVTFYREG
ncbi:MAG TPA: DUF2249 domain-containing protein [Limnochordales bacterium]